MKELRIHNTNKILRWHSEAHLEPSRTSAMEFFAKIFHGKQPSTIFTKKLHRRFSTEFQIHLCYYQIWTTTAVEELLWGAVILMTSQPVFACSNQQWKHQSNVRNLLQVSNKDTTTTSMNVEPLYMIDFTQCSCVSIVDFAQVKTSKWSLGFLIRTHDVMALR